MRKDDNTMMVMTGLVLAIGIGIFAERMSSGFGGPDVVQGQPVEDRFMLRAGVPMALDVLSNDGGLKGLLQVTTGPSCGAAEVQDNKIIYSDSGQCGGQIQLTYCVGDAPDCVPATVSLTVQANQQATAQGTSATDGVMPRLQSTKIDLVPLPLQPVVKPGPEFALIPQDKVEDASLRIFVATLSGSKGILPAAELQKFLVSSSSLDVQPVSARPGELSLSARVPDPLASAGFLRSYATAPGGQIQDDPFVVTEIDNVKIVALPDEEQLNVTLPSQREFVVEDVAPESDTQQIEQVAARFDDEVKIGPDCEISTNLAPAPGAHLTLTLSAPCLAGQSIVARSHGFDFLLKVSEEGSLVVDLPALAIDAVVEIDLGQNRGEIRLAADGSDVLRVERSAFRFPEALGLAIAAVERRPNVAPTETTHLDAVPHRSAFLSGRGYMRRYASTNGQVIDVYSLPLSRQVQASTVDMRLVRAEPGTCSGPIALDFLHLGRNQDGLQSAILPVTACASKSGYSLRNVVGAINVASQ